MNLCRQCFREKSQDIGFNKVGFLPLLFLDRIRPDPYIPPTLAFGFDKITPKNRNYNSLTFPNSTGKPQPPTSRTHLSHRAR